MKKVIFVLILIAILFFSLTGCDSIENDISDIVKAPVVESFEASPAVISAGEVSYLHWNVSNAETVHIDNNVGYVAISGTLPVKPISNTTYTLSAVNWSGKMIAKTQVLVSNEIDGGVSEQQSKSPIIDSFSADQFTINSGDPVILNWRVTNADEVTLSNLGEVSFKDVYTVYPSSSITYTLSAVNNYGEANASIDIHVFDANESQDSKEVIIKLFNILEESGSVVKGSDYLSYSKNTTACAGDTTMYLPSRAFLSFDISSIPSYAQIEHAVLDLGDYTRTGNPTYVLTNWGNMGALEVYHLQYGNYENLGREAYNDIGKLTKDGIFTDYPLSPWTWDVKDSNDDESIIQELVTNGMIRSQFRIQFFTSTNWDSVSDMLCFENAELTVTYRLP